MDDARPRPTAVGPLRRSVEVRLGVVLAEAVAAAHSQGSGSTSVGRAGGSPAAGEAGRLRRSSRSGTPSPNTRRRSALGACFSALRREEAPSARAPKPSGRRHAGASTGASTANDAGASGASAAADAPVARRDYVASRQPRRADVRAAWREPSRGVLNPSRARPLEIRSARSAGAGPGRAARAAPRSTSSARADAGRVVRSMRARDGGTPALRSMTRREHRRGLDGKRS